MKWINATDRLPVKDKNKFGRPIQVIIRWFRMDDTLFSKAMTVNEFKDLIKAEWSNKYEWLDESEDQETSALRAENERLRGLLKQTFIYYQIEAPEEAWAKFETENNL